MPAPLVRFELVTLRRTARFTVWGIYDQARAEFREDLVTSREREKVIAEVRRLNDAMRGGRL